VRALAEVELRHVSLVRLSSSRVLAVLVTREGTALRRVVEEEGRGDQAELDRMAAALSETLAGGTLGEARGRLAAESGALRDRADRLRERALRLALQALRAPDDEPTRDRDRLACSTSPSSRTRAAAGAVPRHRRPGASDRPGRRGDRPGGVTVRLGDEVPSRCSATAPWRRPVRRSL
jgi:hypothetical protein